MTAEEEDKLAFNLATKAKGLTDNGVWDPVLVQEMLLLMFAWRYPQVRDLMTKKESK